MARNGACSCRLTLEDETQSCVASGLPQRPHRRGRHLLSEGSLMFVPAMEGQNRGRTGQISWALFGMVSMQKCPVC